MGSQWPSHHAHLQGLLIDLQKWHDSPISFQGNWVINTHHRIINSDDKGPI